MDMILFLIDFVQHESCRDRSVVLRFCSSRFCSPKVL